VPGHDDDFGSGDTFLISSRHFDAGEAGHAHIEDRRVELGRAKRFDRRLAVGADDDFVPQPRQFRAHEFLQRALVVGEQDA